jgi:hypothetical protein
VRAKITRRSGGCDSVQNLNEGRGKGEWGIGNRELKMEIDF